MPHYSAHHTLTDLEHHTSRNIQRHRGLVSPAERWHALGQQPATIWLTGLSGSGKSTLAFALEKELIDRGRLAYVLDGDNVRHGLNRDLGFSAEDRTENIRRIAEVARLFNDAGLFVIAAFISPYRQDRAAAREIIGNAHFIETYLSTDIDVCEQRDPKGLYKKAREGKIADFTGISAPYEPPEMPELTLDTSRASVSDSVEAIMNRLSPRLQRDWLP
ncbi:MAG TPA: adenylyl-sulfate kinase [Rhodocyclaceae bacterium]|nr:adenylyl-sulfate kinase [Rhodocyclaceae bacterium]